MTQKRVRARTVSSAMRKATGKKVVCSKANYIPGSKHGGMKTYAVTTHKRKKK